MTRPEPVQVGLVWLFTTEINFIPLLFHKRSGDNVANLSVAYLPYPFEHAFLAIQSEGFVLSFFIGYPLTENVENH